MLIWTLLFNRIFALLLGQIGRIKQQEYKRRVIRQFSVHGDLRRHAGRRFEPCRGPPLHRGQLDGGTG